MKRRKEKAVIVLLVMPRRGPLQELPIDLFNHNLPTKRPRSPSPSSLYSPAKRRILSEEGLVRFGKSATHALHNHAWPVSSPSPAKKLDFGVPKSSPSTRNTPLRADVAMRSPSLSPSPELKPRTRSTRLTSSPSHDISIPSPTLSARVPTLIPREMPPPPDSQSIHFPGFFVFQDTHFAVLPPLDNESTTGPNLDVPKENVPPRRKTRKAATASPSSKSKGHLFSPESSTRELWGMGKVKTIPGTPGTPKRAFGVVADMDITPTRRVDVGDSPRMTRAAARKQRDGHGKELR